MSGSDLEQTSPQESSGGYGVEPTRFVLETFTARKVVVPWLLTYNCGARNFQVVING